MICRGRSSSAMAVASRVAVQHGNVRHALTRLSLPTPESSECRHEQNLTLRLPGSPVRPLTKPLFDCILIRRSVCICIVSTGAGRTSDLSLFGPPPVPARTQFPDTVATSLHREFGGRRATRLLHVRMVRFSGSGVAVRADVACIKTRNQGRRYCNVLEP